MSLDDSPYFRGINAFFLEPLQPAPPSVFPLSFQSVRTGGTERAVSTTVAATTGFVTSTWRNASATPAGLGTAVMLVRAVPSADAVF